MIALTLVAAVSARKKALPGRSVPAARSESCWSRPGWVAWRSRLRHTYLQSGSVAQSLADPGK
jgi:hypothetical protein